MSSIDRTFAVFFATFAFQGMVDGITFDMSGVGQKCLQEDVQKDVLVVGEYEISDESGLFRVDLEITDSRKHRVYFKEHAEEGKFAFSSDDYDVYDVCFTRSPLQESNVAALPEDLFSAITLNIKSGVEAKSYAAVGEAEHLKPIELELRKLEDLSESIVKDFAEMKRREELHRDTNESTNERMLHFSIFSMVCLLGLAVWQVMYLKQYFKQKKLI
jgi:hypothetical protein